MPVITQSASYPRFPAVVVTVFRHFAAIVAALLITVPATVRAIVPAAVMTVAMMTLSVMVVVTQLDAEVHACVVMAVTTVAGVPGLRVAGGEQSDRHHDHQ